ncbi:Branched-chain-amino-acid aminotransferase 1, mitochondrial [Capsicum chinense]|nr:Branched-chain-amino-acid aminotransferase 1, mitochondrial [Capsicum chinense]
MGSGAVLGVAPAPEYTFLVYACPVGNYFKENEYEEIDWDNLGFKVTQTDYMFVAKSTLDGNFEQGQLKPFGNIQLNPSAGILNYGQIPPAGKGTLYIRPLLMGSGAVLGVAPAPEYTFLVYACPVGNYFKVMKAMKNAKGKGFTDVLIEYKISEGIITQQLNSRLVEIQRGIVEDKRNWIVEVK